MGELTTGSIDLVVTSPPYWDVKDYDHPDQLGKGLTYRHFINLLKKSLLECMRVVKEDGFIVIIVADIRKSGRFSGELRPKIYPIHSDIIQYFTEMDFSFAQHFIWRKMGINKPKGKIIYGSVGKGSNKEWVVPPNLYNDLLIEHILVFRKPGMPSSIPSTKEKITDEYTRISRVEAEQWMDPIWVFDSPKDKLHPATFPKEIVSRLIRLFSLKGDIVLDPFLGTGTTIEVASELHRNAIGYEINRDYLNPLIERFSLQQVENHFHLSSEISGQ